MPWVTLTEQEREAAIARADLFFHHNISVGARPKYGQNITKCQHDLRQGRIGEVAVAKLRGGRVLNEVGNYRLPDVVDADGSPLEVRATKYWEWMSLLMHPWRPDDKGDKYGRPYFLAGIDRNDEHRVFIAGYCYLDWVVERHDRFWGDRANNNRPCYWIEAPHLQVRFE